MLPKATEHRFQMQTGNYGKPVPSWLVGFAQDIVEKAKEIHGHGFDYELYFREGREPDALCGITNAYFEGLGKKRITLHVNPDKLDRVRKYALNQTAVLDEAIHVAHNDWWEDIANADLEVKEAFDVFKESVDLKKAFVNRQNLARFVNTLLDGKPEKKEREFLLRVRDKIQDIAHFTEGIDHAMLIHKNKKAIEKEERLSEKDVGYIGSIMDGIEDKKFQELVKNRKTSEEFVNKTLAYLRGKGFHEQEAQDVAQVFQTLFLRENKRFLKASEKLFGKERHFKKILGHRRQEAKLYGEPKAIASLWESKQPKKDYVKLYNRISKKHENLRLA